MRLTPRSAAGAAFIAATLAPTAARAQAQVSYYLVWERAQGAETCPVRADFEASVRGRLGVDPFQEGSSRHLLVHLSRTSEKWRAELGVLEDGLVRGSQQLEADGTDCEALFAAVVSVAAVMLGAQPVGPDEAEPVTLTESKVDPEKSARPAPGAASTWSLEPSPPERKRAPDPDEMPARQWSLGIEVAQDLQVIPDGKDVCPASDSFTCFEQDGSLYRGYAGPGTDNRVASGLLIGNPRLLGNAQALLLPRLGVELRAGWAFGGEAFSDTSNEFVPWHVEMGARFWIGSPSSRLRGYVGTGFGRAEFTAKFQVSVEDCGPLSSTDIATAECIERIGPGTWKKLDVYQRLGRFFVPLRIGATWRVAGDHALTLGLSTSYTFPSTGVVLQPSFGYAAGL